jgi:hypothetical protein
VPRVDRLIARALKDSRVTSEEATELIKALKADDQLEAGERAALTELLANRADAFVPEVRRAVQAFLDGGTPLTRGVVTDPHLSWDTRGNVTLGTPSRAALFVEGVHFDDVIQNQLGDCFLLSSLSALAASNPRAIEDAITDHGDGTFTVRFFEKGRDAPVEVRVDSDLPMKGDGELLYARGRNRAELWPAVLEKAYATWKGGYSELSLGGFASDALRAVTGQESDFYNPIQELSSKETWQLLKDADAGKLAMVTGTGGEPGEGFVPMHMYAVVGVREEGGEKFVKLRNPYGATEPERDGKDNGVFELTLREYRRKFEDLYILQPPAAPS